MKTMHMLSIQSGQGAFPFEHRGPTRLSRDSILAIMVAMIGVVARFSQAETIASLDQAVELCSTARPGIELSDGNGQSSGDPWLAALRQHDYALSRQWRLLDVFAVLVDTEVYRFLPDPADGLTVDTLEPFQLFGGAFELDLGGALDLTFMLTDLAAAEIRANYLSDQILLKLTFQLISLDDPEVSYCQPTDGGNVRILGRLLVAELVARPNHAVLARFETQRHNDRVIRLGVNRDGEYIIPRPRVLVADTSFLGRTPPGNEAELLRLEVETAVLPCYMSGLNLNGRLQGAIVVSSNIESGGMLQDPAIDIDAINQPLVTGCLLGALDQIRLPRTHPFESYDVRMNFIFRLE